MIKQITQEEALFVRKRVNNAVAQDIAEFINSDIDVVEVVASNYKSVESARNAYKVCAKRCGYGVDFTCVKGRLFMFKKEV